MAFFTPDPNLGHSSPESSRASTLSLESLQSAPQISCPENFPLRKPQSIFLSLERQRKSQLARTESAVTICHPPPAFLSELRLKYAAESDVTSSSPCGSLSAEDDHPIFYPGDIIDHPPTHLPPPLPAPLHLSRPPDLEPTYIKLSSFRRRHQGSPCMVTCSLCSPRPQRPSPPSSLRIALEPQPISRPPSAFRTEDSVSVGAPRLPSADCCRIL